MAEWVRVENLLDRVVFFAVDIFRFGRRRFIDTVVLVGGQSVNVEHRMDFEPVREFELVV